MDDGDQLAKSHCFAMFAAYNAAPCYRERVFLLLAFIRN